MRCFPIIIIIFLSMNLLMAQSSFKSQQMQYERVRIAYNEKGKDIKELLKKEKLNLSSIEIMIVAYKKEQILEIWCKNKSHQEYKMLKKYSFAAYSGKLGPKNKQGDCQIPEGFYTIERFNPCSNFYLSLGVSYPNKADRIRSKAANPGGDVFIHGSYVTIGCIPITDNLIKELYIFAVEAKNSGQQNIPVYIFPAYLSKQGYAELIKQYHDTELLVFWQNLKEGFDILQQNKTALNVKVDNSGKYIFYLN